MVLQVNDTEPRAQYAASGGQTAFTYDFEIFVDADLLVYLTPVGQTASDDDDILTLTTDYTVSNAGVTDGGDVTLVVAATAGDIITIVRDVAVARTTNYQTSGDFLATVVNPDFNKIVMMVQQQEDILASRGLSFQDTQNLTGVDTTMPAPVADGLLKWNAAANALQNVALSTLDPSLVTVSAFVETLLDDATADDFWTTLNAAFTSAITLDQALNANGDINSNKTLKIKKGSDVASATALTLGDGNYFDVTGTAAITSISKALGTFFMLHFDGALTLTHHSTNLILPGGANIPTAAGDEALFFVYASGDVRCLSYTKASGEATVHRTLVLGDLPDGSKLDLQTSLADLTNGGADDLTEYTFSSIPSWAKRITIGINDYSTSSTGKTLFQLGDSGGIEATGYLTGSGTVSTGGSNSATIDTDGWNPTGAMTVATDIAHGEIVFTLMNAATFLWSGRGTFISSTGVATTCTVSGTKALSAALTQIKISVASGAMDGGDASIMYE